MPINRIGREVYSQKTKGATMVKSSGLHWPEPWRTVYIRFDGSSFVMVNGRAIPVKDGKYNFL